MSAPSLPAAKVAAIRADYDRIRDKTAVAAMHGVNRMTVHRYTVGMTFGDTAAITPPQPPPPDDPPAGVDCPDPAPEAGGPDCPDAIRRDYSFVDLDTPGEWLVFGDVHLPFHDKPLLKAMVAEARARAVAGVLINGDLLDFYSISDHYREPDQVRFKDEIETGQQFLQWVRASFPRARIVFKEGNHDWRVRRYVATKAPELFGLKQLELDRLLELAGLGVEWVHSKRVIRLGKLLVIHGHELRGGGGVNPARWLYLQTGSTVLCNHFHRTSEHHERTLDRRLHSCWSVGCCCDLYPDWLPANKWNQGWAYVGLEPGGDFHAVNRRVLPSRQIV